MPTLSYWPAPRPRARVAGLAVVSAALAVGSAACADRGPTSPAANAAPRPSVGSVAVAPDSLDALALHVHFTVADADTARVLYRVGTAPERAGPRVVLAAAAASATITLFGVQPGSAVSVRVVARRGAAADTSAPVQASTDSTVPDVVRRVRLQTTAGRPSAGYVLTSVTLGDTAYAVAFDSSGGVAWYRAFPGAGSGNDAYQQPNGHITMYLGTSHGWEPVPGSFAEVRPDGALVRQWTVPDGYYTDAHELRVGAGPDGSTYLFGYNLAPMDFSARGGSADTAVAGHTVFRIDAGGVTTPVFAARDHFAVADWVDPQAGDQDFDHPNSIDVAPDGGLIVSWRHFDEVSKIDPATGRFVWRLGGPHNQFTFVGDPLGGFGGQHDARLLPNGDLLLYDDGTTHAPQVTRAVEYRIEPSAHTATLVWEFRHQPALYTPFVGSVQRLRSGDTFVGYGWVGLATEVTPAGAVVWEGQLTIDGAPWVAYRLLKIAALGHYAAP